MIVMSYPVLVVQYQALKESIKTNAQAQKSTWIYRYPRNYWPLELKKNKKNARTRKESNQLCENVSNVRNGAYWTSCNVNWCLMALTFH